MPVYTVADLPPPQYPPVIIPYNKGQFVAWAMTVAYGCDMGLRQVPIAGPKGTACRFNRQHGGKAQKKIRWLAQAMNGKPPLPHWDTQSNNEVLLAWEIGEPATGALIAGNEIWTVLGTYTYGLQKIPDLASDTLTFGSAPYLASSRASVALYVLHAADFDRLLVGPSQAPAGTGGAGVSY